MKTYEEIKDFFKNNKQSFVLVVCFILVFIVGYGAGGYEKEIRRNSFSQQNNYTIQAQQNPVKNEAGIVAGVTQQATSSNVSLTNCVIKGNISATGKKIFHVQGGAFFERTKPEQCFNTEAEAIAAGFVKSSR